MQTGVLATQIVGLEGLDRLDGSGADQIRLLRDARQILERIDQGACGSAQQRAGLAGDDGAVRQLDGGGRCPAGLLRDGMSGLLSGLGGVMSASRLYSANGNLGVGYELDAIAAVILGGTSFVGGIGTITGTLVGALIIATLNNGMTLMGVSYFWQLVIKGAVIIIAVLIDKYRTRHHQSA